MNFDLKSFIETVGYLGVFLIIFAESGMLIGFFLPGDSLLFTAGLLAAEGFFSLSLLVVVSFLGAVIGDSVGYTFGHKVGRRLFSQKESWLFKKEHLLKAEEFYEKHGGKTIVLARFMPFIRTFAPIVAGIGRMRYPSFLSFNIIGGLLWAIGLPVLGFTLGKSIPDIDKYLLPIIALIVIVSVAPSLLHFYSDNKSRVHALIRKKIFRRS